MEQVNLTSLTIINNDKGDIFRALRKNEVDFSQFGEAYFSTIHKNVIKAWKKHLQMHSNLIVIKGAVKFVCFDGKDFVSHILSREHYDRLSIEPAVWLGFQGLEDENIILNIASLIHDDTEYKTCSIESIDYNWFN